MAQKGRRSLVRRNSVKMDSPGEDKVLVFDGRGSSFLDFGQRVHLRMRATKTEYASRASFRFYICSQARDKFVFLKGEIYWAAMMPSRGFWRSFAVISAQRRQT